MTPGMRFDRLPGHIARCLLPFQAAGGRLPALQAHSSSASVGSCLLAIHKLLKANSVCNCVVFFFNPLSAP